MAIQTDGNVRPPFNPRAVPQPYEGAPAVSRADTGHTAGERYASGDPTPQYTPGNDTYVKYVTDAQGTHKVTRLTNGGGVVGDEIIAPPGGNVKPVLSGTGVGGGISLYEQAVLALDKQKLADAEAQQKADEAYRQSQAIDQFNKNWQDYQVKNYYGSFGGPSSAAPAGSPWFYRLPEPGLIASYYKNNPQAGPDPWSTPIGVSGYSGSGFLNMQQPGTQAVQQPMGATPVSVPGQQAANPFPGQTSGMPATPQMGQAVGQNPNQALIDAIGSHPDANAFAMSLPGVAQAVQAQMAGPQLGIPGSANGELSGPQMGAPKPPPLPMTNGGM